MIKLYILYQIFNEIVSASMMFFLSVAALAPFVSLILFHLLRLMFVFFLLLLSLTVFWSLLLLLFALISTPWTIFFILLYLSSFLRTVRLVRRVIRPTLIGRTIFWTLLLLWAFIFALVFSSLLRIYFLTLIIFIVARCSVVLFGNILWCALFVLICFFNNRVFCLISFLIYFVHCF
jgi:hypothetical protein